MGISENQHIVKTSRLAPKAGAKLFRYKNIDVAVCGVYGSRACRFPVCTLELGRSRERHQQYVYI